MKGQEFQPYEPATPQQFDTFYQSPSHLPPQMHVEAPFRLFNGFMVPDNNPPMQYETLLQMSPATLALDTGFTAPPQPLLEQNQEPQGVPDTGFTAPPQPHLEPHQELQGVCSLVNGLPLQEQPLVEIASLYQPPYGTPGGAGPQFPQELVIGEAGQGASTGMTMLNNQQMEQVATVLAIMSLADDNGMYNASGSEVLLHNSIGGNDCGYSAALGCTPNSQASSLGLLPSSAVDETAYIPQSEIEAFLEEVASAAGHTDEPPQGQPSATVLGATTNWSDGSGLGIEGTVGSGGGAKEESMLLETRNLILDIVAQNQSHRYYRFAKYLTENCELMSETSFGSTHCLRLAYLKDSYNSTCTKIRDRLSANQMEWFLTGVLQMTVTNQNEPCGMSRTPDLWVFGIVRRSLPSAVGGLKAAASRS
jgi:hypothetical protein